MKAYKGYYINFEGNKIEKDIKGRLVVYTKYTGYVNMKELKHHKGYYISEEGLVYSLRSNKMIKKLKDKFVQINRKTYVLEKLMKEECMI